MKVGSPLALRGIIPMSIYLLQSEYASQEIPIAVRF